MADSSSADVFVKFDDRGNAVFSGDNGRQSHNVCLEPSSENADRLAALGDVFILLIDDFGSIYKDGAWVGGCDPKKSTERLKERLELKRRHEKRERDLIEGKIREWKI